MAWTIQIGAGTAALLADIGISDVRLNLNNMLPDELNFTLDGTLFDAEVIFAPAQTVSLFRDSVRVFTGLVTSLPRFGTGSAESVGIQVQGPWFDLRETTLEQIWKRIVTGINPSTTEYGNPHLLLGLSPTGALQTVADSISQILDYAIGSGVSIQKGNILTAATELQYIPIVEIRDTNCADAIRQLLRFQPDAVAWFDYASSPPTIHIRNQRNFGTTTLSLPSDTTPPGSPVNITSAGITARVDLQRPGVVIVFEKSITINGSAYIDAIRDVYPPGTTGRERSALVASVDLKGPTINQSQVNVVTAPILAADSDPATRNAWWMTHYLPFKQGTVVDLVIESPAIAVGQNELITDLINLPNELLDGQNAHFVTNAGGDLATFQRQEYTALASFRILDQNGLGTTIAQAVRMPINCHIMATDAISANFVASQTVETADPQPLGMAKYFYDALSVLQFEGQIELTEQEYSGAVGMGQNINVTGGRTEWATMNAMVQQISIRIDDGRTVVKFGPPTHLGPQDLADLLRATRPRVRYTPIALQQSGGLDQGSLTLGSKLAGADTTSGYAPLTLHALNGDIINGNSQGRIESNANTRTLILTDPAHPTRKIRLELDSAVHGTTDLDIALREYAVCGPDGTTVMHAKLLGSAPY